MTDTITLAHLSDVHLGPLEGFSPRHWNAKRWLGYLNWHRGRRFVHRRDILDRVVADIHAQAPDHIVLTGDLANIGLPREFEGALAWLEILGSPERVTVIPGNHDIYTSLRGDRGVARWSRYMTADAWGADFGATGEAAFPFVRRVGPLALIGLNSAVPQPPFIAAGRLGPAQLEALSGILKRLTSTGLARVVLIHHSPIAAQAPRLRALEDATGLKRVLAAHGADLVLHGHNHHDTVEWMKTASGAVPIVGAASASAGRLHRREPLARYNLLRFSRTDGGWAIEHQRRGLKAPDGPVMQLERGLLQPGNDVAKKMEAR